MKLLFILYWLLLMPVAQGMGIIQDLSSFKEDASLGENGEAKLYALTELDRTKVPVIFVHGIFGEPRELEPIIAPFRGSRYQLYVLAYSDLHLRTSLNGKDFGKQLMILRDQVIGPDRDITIIAHSMGGLVSREALRTLGPELIEFGKIRLYTADTPWHGFAGPSDQGLGRHFMRMARLLMPDGLEDMRAKSDFFSNLYAEKLPGNVLIHLAFAEEGKDIKDYTEMNFRKNSAKSKNLSQALESSINYKKFDEEFKMSDQSEETTKILWLKHFPRFSGNHDGILKGNYIEFLKQELL